MTGSAPVVTITSPEPETAFYSASQTIVLEADALEREDGQIAAIEWLSNRDGALAAGSSSAVRADALSRGAHVLTARATDTDGQTGSAEVVIYVFGDEPVLELTVDIRPWSASNPVNRDGQELLPVAILSTQGFDATSVDALSVRFGPGGATEAHGRGHVEDADGDACRSPWRLALVAGPSARRAADQRWAMSMSRSRRSAGQSSSSQVTTASWCSCPSRRHHQPYRRRGST